MIVVSRTVLFFIVFVATFSLSIAQLKYHQVTISLSNNFTLTDAVKLGVELDHGARISENSLTCIVNDYFLDTLQLLKIPLTIEQYDLSNIYAQRIADEKRTHSQYSNLTSKKLYGSMGNFLTLEEIYEIFASLMQQYPTLISREQIGTTFENRPIYAFHIGEDTVKDSRTLPRTLVTSLHHAREAITPTITCFFAQDFFEKVANQDPFSLYVLKHSPITIIPCLNPDGYEYNRTTNPNGGGMWRKNRRTLSNTSGIGVDVNRNYGPKEFWNSPNGGSATNGNSDTYRGDSAFSEAETQAMRYMHETYDIKTALNFHSFSNLIVTPVSYSGINPPDEKAFHYFCAHQTVETRYPFGRDVQMVNYPARGSSDDYLYLGTGKKVLAITPEVGSFSDGFWPTLSRIYPLVQTNLPSIYAAIRSTLGIPFLYSYESFVYEPNQNGQTVSLHFSSTSLQPLKPFSLQIRALDPSINLSLIPIMGADDFQDTIYRIRKHFGITLDSQTLQSGSTLGIVVEQQYNDFSFFDTLFLQKNRKDLMLYSGQSTLEEVALKGWEIEFDDENKVYSLTESVNSLTRPNMNFTTMTTKEISLENCSDAYLQFNSTWDFGANKDGVFAFFQDNETNEMFPLTTNRTQNFTNASNSPKFEVGTPILNGKFTNRITQSASLRRFLGKSGKIGFQVRSANGPNYNGFNLYWALVSTYSETPTNLSETKNGKLTISDVFNALTFTILRDQKSLNPMIDCNIYTVNGVLIYSQQYEWGSQSYKGISIFKDVFPSGAYVLSITIDGQIIKETFTVVR